MKRLVLVAAVLFVAMGVGAIAASDSEQVRVNFTIDEFLQLNVSHGKTVNFGKLDPTQRRKAMRGATMLEVESNTFWQIDASTKVLEKPNRAPSDRVIRDFFQTKIHPGTGFGDREGIKVDYTLNGLDLLTAGKYSLQVTFTASTR